MKKQLTMTHKEAVKKALEELGGRARLGDIYLRAIPCVKYKPGSNIEATLRRLLQTTPELFHRVEGMKGWWELVSYQKELAEKDKKIAELAKSQITQDEIIRAFNDFDTVTERIYAKQMMQLMFRGNIAWDTVYKKMRDAGYFKEGGAQIILNNPQFNVEVTSPGNIIAHNITKQYSKEHGREKEQ